MKTATDSCTGFDFPAPISLEMPNDNMRLHFSIDYSPELTVLTLSDETPVSLRIRLEDAIYDLSRNVYEVLENNDRVCVYTKAIRTENDAR